MKKSLILLIAIIILAASLRLYKLGNNPFSLYWDETSLGYNALSILQTGKDEYGVQLPLSFKSFGDYKPPAYIYFTVPSIAFFGANAFSVRLPSALAGMGAVIIMYFLAKVVLNDNKLALLSSFFMAVSPWSIQFSRGAFEANLGLFWTLLYLYGFVKALKQPRLFILTAIPFVLGLYSYHTYRLFLPMITIVLLSLYRNSIKIWQPWIWIFSGLIFLSFLPLIFNWSQTVTRLSAVTVAQNHYQKTQQLYQQQDIKTNDVPAGKVFHNHFLTTSQQMVAGYLDHFTPNFLFLKGDMYGRHNAVGMGMLYIWDVLFLVAGFSPIFFRYRKFLFILSWLILAPAASALTSGTPHAIRALILMPVMLMIIAVGYSTILKKYSGKSNAVMKMLVVICFSINAFYYLNLYYVHSPVETASSWQYGYKQLVEYVKVHEHEVDKIVISNAYDQPYIYFLFYLPIDPSRYQRIGNIEPNQAFRSFAKYEFRPIEFNQDINISHALVAITPKDFQGHTEKDLPYHTTIRYPDGSVVFYIIQR